MSCDLNDASQILLIANEFFPIEPSKLFSHNLTLDESNKLILNIWVDGSGWMTIDTAEINGSIREYFENTKQELSTKLKEVSDGLR
jgi:hypothetical protein